MSKPIALTVGDRDVVHKIWSSVSLASSGRLLRSTEIGMNMKNIRRHIGIWLFVSSVIFLWTTPGLTAKMNKKTTKGNIALEIRWASGVINNVVYVETEKVRRPGELRSKNDTVYLLFVGTKIRNNADKNLRFNLNDFQIKVGDKTIKASAYLTDTPVFVATEENTPFSIEPNKEMEVGIGFMNVPKAHASLHFKFLDLQEISFSKPPIQKGKDK